MKQFTHLHLHTHYSLLDGMSRMPELMDRAKELGFEAIASPITACSTAPSSSMKKRANGASSPSWAARCTWRPARASTASRRWTTGSTTSRFWRKTTKATRISSSWRRRRSWKASTTSRGQTTNCWSISRGSHLPFGLSGGRDSAGAPGWERGQGAGIGAPLPRFVWRG